MFTCKLVSRALAKERYQDMSPVRQRLLRFHLWWCTICGPYNGNILELEEAVERFLEREQADDLEGGEHLSEEARHRMQQELMDALTSEDDPQPHG